MTENFITIEKKLINDGKYEDIFQYLHTSEETKNLIEVINCGGFYNYIKKDTSMLLLQMLIVNYFSTVHAIYNPLVHWFIPAEYRLRYFLQDAYSIYSEHPDIFSKKPERQFLTVTSIGYKVLEKSNLFLAELYKDVKSTFGDNDVPNSLDLLLKTPKINKYYENFIEIFKILFQKDYPRKTPDCSKMFGLFLNLDGYEDYNETVAKATMRRFIGNLLVFSYTCNGGWVVPRQNKRGLTESNSNADTLRNLCNGDRIHTSSSKRVLQNIEWALPDIATHLSKLEKTEIVSNESLNIENRVTKEKVNYKYPVPEGFREAHAKYYSKEISMQKFSAMFHVSDTKIREWMKECNLPVRKRGIKNDISLGVVEPSSVSVEPSIQQTSPMKERIISFNLFGHKVTIRNPFKIEKTISSITTDDFEDFVEY